MEAHHERQKEAYASNPDIDSDRSRHNFHIVQPKTSYRKESEQRIEAAGCRTRKDSVQFVDTLITASPSFFKGKKPSEVKAFFEQAVDFLADRIGKDNIFSAVVHMDEKTPHLHLCFTPITPDGRLSAKDILGNRTRLSQWQDDFHAHMVKQYPELERGESAMKTNRKHIPPRIFKQAARLSKQAARIDTLLTNITPLNAGKKRNEITVLLAKWFPDMEKFETTLKKYQNTITLLEQENKQLAEKAAVGSEQKIKTQLQIGKLQNDLNEMRRFYDAVPDEWKQHIRQLQKTDKTQQQQR